MKRFLLFVFVSLAFFEVSAQSKNVKATLNVDGVCTSCKSRIERSALSVKGVKFALWNVETHHLSLVFNQKKTDLATIQRAIASSGHSNNLFGEKPIEALGDSYNLLPSCCKYKDPEVVKNHK